MLGDIYTVRGETEKADPQYDNLSDPQSSDLPRSQTTFFAMAAAAANSTSSRTRNKRYAAEKSILLQITCVVLFKWAGRRARQYIAEQCFTNQRAALFSRGHDRKGQRRPAQANAAGSASLESSIDLVHR